MNYNVHNEVHCGLTETVVIVNLVISPSVTKMSNGECKFCVFLDRDKLLNSFRPLSPFTTASGIRVRPRKLQSDGPFSSLTSSSSRYPCHIARHWVDFLLPSPVVTRLSRGHRDVVGPQRASDWVHPHDPDVNYSHTGGDAPARGGHK